MQRDGAVLNMVLRIFLRVIAHSLQSNSDYQSDPSGDHAGRSIRDVCNGDRWAQYAYDPLSEGRRDGGLSRKALGYRPATLARIARRLKSF